MNDGNAPSESAAPVSANGSRLWLSALVGAVLGFLVGVVADGTIWLYAFAATLNGTESIDVPLIVKTSYEGQDVVATSGLGVLVVPVVAAALGAAVGALLARRSRRRTLSTEPLSS